MPILDGLCEWVAQCVALVLASLTGRLWRLTGGWCPEADTPLCVGCILRVHPSLTLGALPGNAAVSTHRKSGFILWAPSEWSCWVMWSLTLGCPTAAVSPEHVHVVLTPLKLSQCHGWRGLSTSLAFGTRPQLPCPRASPGTLWWTDGLLQGAPGSARVSGG